MANILIINGPNLNLLGSRETTIYGNATLDDINANLSKEANKLGHDIQCLQRNAEHEIVEAIHQAKSDHIEFIIINPGAFTHTSIAIRDALLGVDLPFIEVHLSNLMSRETFRHHSYLSDIAIGVIFGFGPKGYELALLAANHYLQVKLNRKTINGYAQDQKTH